MAKHAGSPDKQVSVASQQETSGRSPERTSGGDSAKAPKETEQQDSVLGAQEYPADTTSSSEEEDAAFVEAGEGQTDDTAEIAHRRSDSSIRLAIGIGAAVIVGLSCAIGWWGYRAYEDRHAKAESNLFVTVARQGALNLTTIDYTRVDADVQRILDSSTGAFHDDFQQRSAPFVDVVKKAQSKSEGTVTEAGLESQDGDQAQVLVGVSVKTSNAGVAEPDLRRWRMRIAVQKVGDDVKVSDVQFVP